MKSIFLLSVLVFLGSLPAFADDTVFNVSPEDVNVSFLGATIAFQNATFPLAPELISEGPWVEIGWIYNPIEIYLGNLSGNPSAVFFDGQNRFESDGQLRVTKIEFSMKSDIFGNKNLIYHYRVCDGQNNQLRSDPFMVTANLEKGIGVRFYASGNDNAETKECRLIRSNSMLICRMTVDDPKYKYWRDAKSVVSQFNIYTPEKKLAKKSGSDARQSQ